jgi:hypothetical protein
MSIGNDGSTRQRFAFPSFSGVVRLLVYASYVCVGAAVVLGGSHEHIAGISLAAAGVLLLAALGRAVTHPEELTVHGGPAWYPTFARVLVAILGAAYVLFGIVLAAS